MRTWKSPHTGYASRSAWKDGYQAYLNGRPRTACMIARGVEGRSDWLAGWDYGEREAAKKRERETSGA